MFDLRILLREIWRWKWALLLIVLVGGAKGATDAHKFSPTYVAQMIVEPKLAEGQSLPTSGGGGLFSAARSFGFVPSGVGQATQFQHLKQTIGSRKLAAHLQQKYGLLQKVFSGSWDNEAHAWIQPVRDNNSIRSRIRKYFHYNSPRLPDIGTLANYVGGSVQIKKIKDTPFYNIVVENNDRDFALYLLEIVSKEADELLGERDRRKQVRDRRYIEEQLEKSQLLEVRSNLLAMMMQQEQKSMLINAEPPYTINILELPWVSALPEEPNLARIIGIPMLTALAFGLIILTLFVSFRME